MKNILYIIAGMIFISSCSIAKRQYNSGFAIDFNRTRNQPIEVETVAKKKSQPAQKADLAVAKNQNTDKFTQLELNTLESNNQTISVQLKATENKDKAASNSGLKTNKAVSKIFNKVSKKINNAALENKITIPNSLSKNLPSESNSMDDRGCIISVLIFLCCLFIPPLGYILSTGEADTKFWICLICFLLAGGLYFGVGFSLGGLLGIIAIVLALLAFFGS